MTALKPVRVRKARATTVCPYCKTVILRGEQIASQDRRPFGHIAHYLPAENVGRPTFQDILESREAV